MSAVVIILLLVFFIAVGVAGYLTNGFGLIKKKKAAGDTTGDPCVPSDSETVENGTVYVYDSDKNCAPTDCVDGYILADGVCIQNATGHEDDPGVCTRQNANPDCSCIDGYTLVDGSCVPSDSGHEKTPSCTVIPNAATYNPDCTVLTCNPGYTNEFGNDCVPSTCSLDAFKERVTRRLLNPSNYDTASGLVNELIYDDVCKLSAQLHTNPFYLVISLMGEGEGTGTRPSRHPHSSPRHSHNG